MLLRTIHLMLLAAAAADDDHIRSAMCADCVCVQTSIDEKEALKSIGFLNFSKGACQKKTDLCGSGIKVIDLDSKDGEKRVKEECDSTLESSTESSEEFTQTLPSSNPSSSEVTEAESESLNAQRLRTAAPKITAVTQTDGTTEVIPTETQDTPITFTQSTTRGKHSKKVKDSSDMIGDSQKTMVAAASAAGIALFGVGGYALFQSERSGSNITNSQPSCLHESSGGEEEIPVTMARTDML